MELEDQICSLESANKLEELGVKQDSLWGYLDHGDLNFSPVLNRELIYLKAECSAFTVAELGELLPPTISNHEMRTVRRSDGLFSIWYENGFNGNVLGSNINDSSFMPMNLVEAEARAKMLIYLLENKLLKR